MQLVIEQLLDFEVSHHCDHDTKIMSKCNRLVITHGGTTQSVKLPLPIHKAPISLFRLGRRLLRTDKSVFLPIYSGNRLEAVVGVYQKKFYRVEWPTLAIKKTGEFRQGKVPLHQSICQTERGSLLFGEYSSNKLNASVPVWKSEDKGNSWRVAFEIPREKAIHIHGCFWDPFEKKVWICTGDQEGECHILCTDEDFKAVEWLGDGTQTWRTCHLIFKKDCVLWGMDSPLTQSSICKLDRKTRTLEKVFEVPGPVWYGKDLDDGWLLFASSVENGPSVQTDYAKIFVSHNYLDWQELFEAKKDNWHGVLFKFGVFGFAAGTQDSSCFHLFAEALNGLDGKVARCKITQ